MTYIWYRRSNAIKLVKASQTVRLQGMSKTIYRYKEGSH